MEKKLPESDLENLPRCAMDFIKSILKKMRYRKKVRAEVQAELATDFEAELKECKSDDEKIQVAEKLITDYGDIKLLAILLRRAKKRCRPLWQKCLIQTSKVIGIVILYIIIRVVFLMAGTPNITTDYAIWLNELVRAKRPEKLNAQIYYNKAVELFVERPPIISNKRIHSSSSHWLADFNDLEIKCLANWLNDNQPAFEMLRQGASKPYYWLTYSSDDTELVSSGVLEQAGSNLRGSSYWQAAVMHNIMKPQAEYRKIARAMSDNILYEANNRHINVALNDCIVLQEFSVHLQGKGLLIEQLVGIAIEALSHDRFFAILGKIDVTSDVLKDFHEQFVEHCYDRDEVINLEAEKAFWYDLIQHGFTDDGKGGGRVLRKGLPLVVGDWKQSVWGFFSWNYPDRREVTRTIDEYFYKIEQLLEKAPWQLRDSDNYAEELSGVGDKCYMLKILWPAHGRIGELVWRLKTHRTALLTVLAVLQYHKDKQQYPKHLEELITAGYLKRLPADPYSGKPLVYKKTDANFILYSLGLNFKDDDGQVFKDDKGKIKKWAEEGDWVFWPVLDK